MNMLLMLSNHLLFDVHVHLRPLFIRGVRQMYDHWLTKEFCQLLQLLTREVSNGSRPFLTLERTDFPFVSGYKK